MQQKIAIPTCDGVLFPHFGKAPQLTVFTVTDGDVTASETLTAPEHEHGSMPRFIQSCGCTDTDAVPQRQPSVETERSSPADWSSCYGRTVPQTMIHFKTGS